MIVALMAPQLQRIAYFLTGVLEQVRVQLGLQKLVGKSLVDEDLRLSGRVLHADDELGGVVTIPLPAVRTQITGERLLSPGTLFGRRNGREGRHRAITIRITQRDGERPMPTHGMSENSRASGVGRKLRFDQHAKL